MVVSRSSKKKVEGEAKSQHVLDFFRTCLVPSIQWVEEVTTDRLPPIGLPASTNTTKPSSPPYGSGGQVSSRFRIHFGSNYLEFNLAQAHMTDPVLELEPVSEVLEPEPVWEVVRKVREAEAHWRRWVCKLVRTKRMRRVWAALGHRLKDLRDVPRLM